MLLNLGDIAAVVPGTVDKQDKDEALQLANQITACRTQGGSEHEELLLRLTAIIKKPSCCLGLKPNKVDDVLADWTVLVESIRDSEVKGNRGLLKRRLLYLEQNPTRTIQRILRLLRAAAESSNAAHLMNLLSPAFVESVLVGALGSHQFQQFCQQFASAVKLDYSLNFFRAIVCACTRKALQRTSLQPSAQGKWHSLSTAEAQTLEVLEPHELQGIINHVTSLFVRVLHGIITRYAGVLESGGLDARRFGFQMRDLTSDDNIREAIIDLLCFQESKDHVALTWIADEVTIWSLD